jgi:hypothetical protein
MDGVPMVFTKYHRAIKRMIQFNNHYLCRPGEYIHLADTDNSYHSTARNNLAKDMLGDWLLMLDTDHDFEPDLLLRLLDILNRGNLDVLTGFYVHRRPPYTPVMFDFHDMEPQQVIDWNRHAKLFPVNCAGGGCLLVRKRVFERIRKELKCEPFDIIHPLGEDFSFFKRLQMLKIPAYMATSIESKHLDIRPVGLADYDAIMPSQVTGSTAAQMGFQLKHARGKILNIGCADDAANFKALGAVNLDVTDHNPVTGEPHKPDLIHDARLPIPLQPVFDTVIVGEVIEHMDYEDAVKVLTNARAMVYDGGYVLVTCPDDSRSIEEQDHAHTQITGNVVTMPVKDRNYAPGSRAYHDHPIDLAQLTSLIEQAGMKIFHREEIDYLGMFKGNGVLCR